MELITKFLKNKDQKPQIQDDLPAYEPGNYELDPEKSEKSEVNKLTKQYLYDTARQIVDDRNRKIDNEIHQIIKDYISKDSTIRFAITVTVGNKITNTECYQIHNFKVDFLFSKYADRGHCSTTVIFVIVKNTSIKDNVTKYLSNLDYIKLFNANEKISYSNILYDYDKFKIENESILTKYNIDKQNNNTFVILYPYELLATNKVFNNCELAKSYYDAYKNMDQAFNKLREELIQRASSGETSYERYSSDSEFCYEYFKYKKTFSDLDMTFKNNKICFSWNI